MVTRRTTLAVNGSGRGLHIAKDPPRTNEDKHVVEKSDIVKGYEYEKGKYAIIEPDDLKRLRIPGKEPWKSSSLRRPVS